MPPATPAEKPKIKSIEDLLKGTYCEKFSDYEVSNNKTFIEAVHAYYAAMVLRRDEPVTVNSRDPEVRARRNQQDAFYKASREEVLHEVRRVQENLPDKQKAYFDPPRPPFSSTPNTPKKFQITVPATGLFGIISNAAINDRETQITFADNKGEAQLIEDVLARANERAASESQGKAVPI